MTPEQMRLVAGFAAALGKLKANEELGQPAELTPGEVAGIIWGVKNLRPDRRSSKAADKIDAVTEDGQHRYWSTHCRHDRHDACKADHLRPGIPRNPAQCKTCAAPCICSCHQEGQ